MDRSQDHGLDLEPSFYENTDSWHVTLGDSDSIESFEDP